MLRPSPSRVSTLSDMRGSWISAWSNDTALQSVLWKSGAIAPRHCNQSARPTRRLLGQCRADNSRGNELATSTRGGASAMPTRAVEGRGDPSAVDRQYLASGCRPETISRVREGERRDVAAGERSNGRARRSRSAPKRRCDIGRPSWGQDIIWAEIYAKNTRH